LKKVVYRATATGTRSVHRQSRWLAGMCHCNGLWPTGSPPRRPQAKWRRRVDDL